MKLPAGAVPFSGTLRSVNVIGLSDEARADLLGRLPVHTGDVISEETGKRTIQAVRDFDEHLQARFVPMPNGETTILIMAPNSSPAPAPRLSRSRCPRPHQGRRQCTAGQAGLAARPPYPPEAKMARIQGVVKLSAVIGRDGAIQQLDVISGHPLLVPAALEAVKQWVYEVTLLNGNPVEVVTQIDVNFTPAEVLRYE